MKPPELVTATQAELDQILALTKPTLPAKQYQLLVGVLGTFSRRESEDAKNRSTRRRENSTNLLWHSIGNDHGNGMESRLAVRIWVRTHCGATRPSVDVQSAPRFIATSIHAKAGIPFIKEEIRIPPLD